jgi:ABC-type transport system involved in multi-copper enzyme maturation permease subunit
VANPVLQRELVAHLRHPRAFVLQGMVTLLLGSIIVAAWPSAREIDLSEPGQGEARKLFELFFIGQFMLAALTTPAFAAGSLAGEKERKSYEMLLASALRPSQIVWAKWAAALVPAVLLIVSSFPLIMLCLPLGGVSFYEVIAAYALLLTALACFSLVSLTCSAYYARTTSALITSYLLVLPASLIGIGLWSAYGAGNAGARLVTFLTLVPPSAAGLIYVLFTALCSRLWYPPDIGSEGREIVDEKEELKQAVGLVIRRDEFPDRLFAPAKRTGLMPDDVNPVLDKEMRSELFSQGTLMLRLVVQISLLLAVPIMGVCLYFHPAWAPWYFSYVLLFNLLVGPVFSAGAVSGERERQTLDLLLVTTLRPGTILWGKLLSGLRISGVLTSFLLWPVLLALVLVPEYYGDWLTFVLAIGLVGMTCLFTSVTALFSSICFRKSNTSLTCAYLALAAMFVLTPAADFFGRTFVPDSAAALVFHGATVTSPFAAAFALPLTSEYEEMRRPADWPLFFAHLGFQWTVILVLVGMMIRMFRNRYDAAGGIS